MLKYIRLAIESTIVRAINRHGYLHDKLDNLRDTIVAEAEKSRELARFHHLEDATIHFYSGASQVSMYIPNADLDDIQRQILKTQNFYELELLNVLQEYLPQERRTVIDVGANIGNHSIYFAKICKFSNCIAFEPNPLVFSILRKNIKINELSELIDIRQSGVGAVASSAYLGPVNPINLGATTLTGIGNAVDRVEVIAIDDLALKNVDLLKVDVEGMAVDVLKGAKHTIEACKPLLYIELFEDEYAEASKILKDLNYNLECALPWGYYIFKASK